MLSYKIGVSVTIKKNDKLTRLVPSQEKFAQMIQEAGFQRVEYENLVGGVVAIHSGLKL